MKINELDNLWVSQYKKASALIVASDQEEAMDLSVEYFNDLGFAPMPHDIKISTFDELESKINLSKLRDLWVAENTSEDFKVLVVASYADEAKDIACDYFNDSGIDFNFDDINISKFKDPSIQFDCDYAISSGSSFDFNYALNSVKAKKTAKKEPAGR